MMRADVEKRYPGLYERLGTVPDAKLAAEYGLTGPGVKRIRDALGIGPCGERTAPTDREWKALCSLKGEIVISPSRKAVTVGGTTVRGRTLRQAVQAVLKALGPSEE